MHDSLKMSRRNHLARILHTNANCLVLLAVFAFFAGILNQSVHTHRNTYSMDPTCRDNFLASVEAEEEWLDKISRRLSQSGTPSAPTAPDLPETPSVPSPPDSRSSAGPVRRSGRKRKSTSEPFDLRRGRMATAAPPAADKSVLDQLKDMMKEMREVRKDVNRSEASTSSKIDSLSNTLTDRLGKAEQSVKNLSRDVVTLRADVSKAKRKNFESAVKLEKMVEDVVDRKLMASKNDYTAMKNDSLRRPRRMATGANLAAEQEVGDPNSNKEHLYLKARRSLKLWPVQGPDLAVAAVEFMRTRLKLPAGRVIPDDLEVSEIYTPQDSPIRNQVLVCFHYLPLSQKTGLSAITELLSPGLLSPALSRCGDMSPLMR